MASMEANTFAGHCILSIPNPLPQGITRSIEPMPRPRIILLGCHSCNTIWQARGRPKRSSVEGGASDPVSSTGTRKSTHNSDCTLTTGIRAAYSMSIWSPAWRCWACDNINKERLFDGYAISNFCRKCGMPEGVGCVRGWAIGPGLWDDWWPRGLVEDLEDVVRTAASARTTENGERVQEE